MKQNRYWEEDSQFLKTEPEIEMWLKSMKIGRYSINQDLTVDVWDDVCINGKDLGVIPVKFDHVDGNFDCSGNHLGSLKGCPEKVVGSFNCRDNDISSLEYAPNDVEGSFDCSINLLTSLEYSPKFVNGHFDCSQNRLSSLEFAPEEVNRSFNCRHNKLTTLEFSPKKIGGEYDCGFNKLTTLEYIPPNINGNFECRDNPFINPTYNELEPEELLNYFEMEKFQKKLQAELPKQDDFRTIIDSKQIQELHALILEKNKSVEIPDTYINATNKPKDEIKESPTITQDIKSIQTQQPIKHKFKL